MMVADVPRSPGSDEQAARVKASATVRMDLSIIVLFGIVMNRRLLHSFSAVYGSQSGVMRKSAAVIIALAVAGCSMNDGDEVDRIFADYRLNGSQTCNSTDRSVS